MSTLVFGPDNPYRAPTVARDVATFQGAELEFARTPKVSSTPLDFFYEGAQSFQQAYDLTKKHYEKSAIDSMYKIESEKAQNILNGMEQEEVNRRYAEGYTQLADSGSISKNLDAFKVLTENHVKAREVVVGDVAQEQYDMLQQELAENGYSYVETQKIVAKYQRRWKGSRVGDRLDDQLNQINNKAKAAERDAAIQKWVKQNSVAAQMNLFPKNATADDRDMQWSQFRGDPNNPVSLYDEDGNIDTDALTHIGNAIYDNHYSEAVQGLSPEQQGYAETLLREQATAQAAAWADLKAADDWAYRREEEIANSAAVVEDLIKTSPDVLSQTIFENPDLTIDGHIDGVEDIYQASFAAELKTMTKGREGQALSIGWGSGQGSLLHGMLGMADSPEELKRLSMMFPPEDFEKAKHLGYTYPNDTPRTWASRRQKTWEEAIPLMADRMGELTLQSSRNNDIRFMTSIGKATTPQDAIRAVSEHGNRNQALRDGILSFGDELVGQNGATAAAKEQLYSNSDPRLEGLVQTLYQLDADALRLESKTGGGGNKPSSADATKAYNNQYFFSGGSPTQQHAAALLQATEGQGNTVPSDNAVSKARDMSRALLGDELSTMTGSIYRLGQYIAQNGDDVEAMENMPFGEVWMLSQSETWQNSLQGSPHQRGGARGLMAGTLMAALDNNGALVGPDARTPMDQSILDEFQNLIDDNTDAFLAIPGNIEMADQLWATTLRHSLDRTGKPDEIKARRKLNQWFGEEKANTIIAGSNIAQVNGFGAIQDGNKEVLGYQGQDEEGNPVDKGPPKLELLNNPAEQVQRSIEVRQSNRNILETFYPNLTGGADFTNLNERVVAIVDGTAGEDFSSPGDQQINAVLEDMMKDSWWAGTDSFFEQELNGLGIDDRTSKIRSYVKQKFTALEDTPMATDLFQRGMREWQANNPLSLTLQMNERAKSDETARWLKGSIEAGMKAMSGNFFLHGGKLHQKTSSNATAQSTTKVMNQWETFYTDDVRGGGHLWSEGLPPAEQQGTLLTQADLSDWRRKLGFHTIQGKRDLYNGFYGTDLMNAPEDPYALEIAMAATMTAEWTVNGESPWEAVLFTLDEDGRRVIDSQALQDMRWFFDNMGERFGIEKIIGPMPDELPLTLQTAIYALAYAGGQKAARHREGGISSEEIIGVLEDYGESGNLAGLLPLFESPTLMTRDLSSHPTGYEMRFGEALYIPVGLPTHGSTIGGWPSGIATPWFSYRGGPKNPHSPSYGGGFGGMGVPQARPRRTR